MLARVTKRKTITISQTLTGKNNFNYQIDNINFVADIVVVKTVVVGSSANTNNFAVYSDLIGDILFVTGVVNSVQVVNPMTSFIPRGGNGLWNFSLRGTNLNDAYTPNGNCIIHFQLEFVKW
jgi:hypothetical protein